MARGSAVAGGTAAIVGALLGNVGWPRSLLAIVLIADDEKWVLGLLFKSVKVSGACQDVRKHVKMSEKVS